MDDMRTEILAAARGIFVVGPLLGILLWAAIIAAVLAVVR